MVLDSRQKEEDVSYRVRTCASEDTRCPNMVPVRVKFKSSALDHSAKLSFDGRGRLNIVIRLLAAANVDNQLNLEQDVEAIHASPTCTKAIPGDH